MNDHFPQILFIEFNVTKFSDIETYDHTSSAIDFNDIQFRIT